VLAVGTEDGVRLLDPRSGRPRGALPGSGAVRGLAFSPDGSLLAISSTGGLRLWNISSGGATPLDRRGIFTRLTFARGGDLLVAATFDPNAPVNDVHVFDVAGRKETQVLRSFGAVDDLAVDPSGSRLAMAELDWKSGLGEVTLWNARTWKRAGAPIRFPALEITTVAFSPDGEQLALGAADGTAGVWTLDGRQLTAFRGHTSAIGQVAFGRGGLEVATTSFDGTARVWRTRPDDELEIAVGPPGSFVGGGLLEQGRLVAVSFPDVVRTWEFPGGKAIGSLSVGTGPNAPAPQLSEDGVLAAAIKPAAIEVWNVAERRAVRRLPLNGEYPIVAFSSDHRRLGLLAEPKGSQTARPSPVVMSLGGSTVLRLARPTRPCASGWRDAEFTRDGTLFAGATFCGDVDVWNAKTGRRVASYAATGQISGIAFDPAGKVLAVSGWDSSLALVEPRTGRLVRVLNGPQRGLTGVALSPDGEIIAASSLDGTVWLWDADGRRLRILRHPSAAAVTGFSADGRFVVTQSDDVLRVWRTCEACEDRDALMALAGSRVTRELTPLERSTFLSGS
jgi:WD40 repeat protein